MTEPTWVWPIIGISALIIAIVSVVAGVLVARIALELRSRAQTVARVMTWLEHDGGPALQSMRQASESLLDITKTIKGEVDAVSDVSKDLRERVVAAADGIEDRLIDVTTLVDMVYEEVEETALDVTAGLRSVRRGRSIWGKVRRALRR